MDILIFIPSLGGGGAETNLVELASTLSDQEEMQVGIAVAYGPDYCLRCRLSPSVPVYDLGVGRVTMAVYPLIGLIRQFRPRLLLASMPNANVVASIAKSLSRSNTRLVLREASTLSSTLKGLSPLKRQTIKQVLRASYARADLVWAVSEGAADDLVNCGIKKSRMRVVYGGVLPDHRQLNAMDVHPWLHESDVPVIVGVGRLEHVKRFDLFVQTLALICRERPVRGIIFGEGRLRDELQGLVESLGLRDVCDLPGYSKNIPEQVSRAGCFLLTSEREGLPGALVAAIATGTPAVAADCKSGPRELTRKFGGIRLVPDWVPSSFAAEVLDVLAEGATGPRRRRGPIYDYFTSQAAARRFLHSIYHAIV